MLNNQTFPGAFDRDRAADADVDDFEAVRPTALRKLRTLSQVSKRWNSVAKVLWGRYGDLNRLKEEGVSANRTYKPVRRRTEVNKKAVRTTSHTLYYDKLFLCIWTLLTIRLVLDVFLS